MAGGITFSGLASGLDTSAIVDQLVQLARAPITRLQQKKSTLDGRVKRLGTLSTKLGDLQKAAQALSTKEKATPATAKSSDEGVLTVRGTSAASIGRYGVEVVSLASADRYYADSFAARDQTGLFGSGTLSLTVGTAASVDIAVDAGDTLDSLATKINASGTGVTASILNTGSGYRLQIAGSQTGTANALTITELGTSLGFGNTGNHVATASDAVVKVDGFTVTRSTNTIEGALPGVTLDLKKTSTVGSPITVEVARDQASLTDKLKAFVTSWNAVSSTIDGESSAPVGTAGTTKSADTLSGDASVRTIQGRLRSLVTSVVPGISGRYTTLGAIGMAVQRGGTLALDETKLAAALQADPDAVMKVLGGTDGLMAKFDTEIDAWTDPSTGMIDARTDTVRSQQRQIDDQIASLELRLDSYETNLRRQFTALESTMSGLQNQGSQLTAAMSRLNG